MLFVGTRIFPNGLLRFQGPRCVWTLAKSRAGEKLFSNALVGIGRLVPDPSEEVAQLDSRPGMGTLPGARTPPGARMFPHVLVRVRRGRNADSRVGGISRSSSGAEGVGTPAAAVAGSPASSSGTERVGACLEDSCPQFWRTCLISLLREGNSCLQSRQVRCSGSTAVVSSFTQALENTCSIREFRVRNSCPHLRQRR